jgi:DnaD/phage-associated family protein
MTKMPWFRVYSEMMSDRKINRICKKTGQSKALVIGLWVCLLSLANESPQRGTLLLAEDIPFSTEDLEDEIGLPEEIITQLLDEFRTYGMISGSGIISIENWGKRQYKSDSSTSRVRHYRARKKAKEHDETLQERYSNALETESETDTEEETESETTTSGDFGQLCTAYEHNIGPLSPMTADMLEDDLGQYGLQICLDAILVAVEQNKRKWAYVRGIMRNWWSDGRGPSKKEIRASQPQKIVLPSGEIVETNV